MSVLATMQAMIRDTNHRILVQHIGSEFPGPVGSQSVGSLLPVTVLVGNDGRDVADRVEHPQPDENQIVLALGGCTSDRELCACLSGESLLELCKGCTELAGCFAGRIHSDLQKAFEFRAAIEGDVEIVVGRHAVVRYGDRSGGSAIEDSQ